MAKPKPSSIKECKMAKKISRKRPDAFAPNSNYAEPVTDAIHHAIKPLDRIANRMELKWGSEQLPALVSCETAQRFGSAKAKLDKAILDNDADAVAKKASVLIKGWQKMDQEAASDGHTALEPNIWSHTTEARFKFAVAQGNADAIKAIRTAPEMEGVAVYSLDEIGRILESDSMKLVNSIKNVFPDSKVTKVLMDDLNDEVPF
tara:strand:+ start:77 stop:688 length:612 start_codon:yes stop_codon:yes gene_type:complete